MQRTGRLVRKPKPIRMLERLSYFNNLMIQDLSETRLNWALYLTYYLLLHFGEIVAVECNSMSIVHIVFSYIFILAVFSMKKCQQCFMSVVFIVSKIFTHFDLSIWRWYCGATCLLHVTCSHSSIYNLPLRLEFKNSQNIRKGLGFFGSIFKFTNALKIKVLIIGQPQ